MRSVLILAVAAVTLPTAGGAAQGPQPGKKTPADTTAAPPATQDNPRPAHSLEVIVKSYPVHPYW